MLNVALYLIISSIGVILFYWNYTKNIKFHKHAAKLPGPKSFPIVGNAHIFIGKNTSEAYYALMEIYQRYSSPSRFWLGNELYVGIYEPDQMKAILTSPKTGEKSDIYRFSSRWFGTGLIIAPAQIWRVRRKLIQPIFNPKILHTFVKSFDKHSNISIKKMLVELEKDEFKVKQYLLDFTLAVANETILGITNTSHSEIYDQFTAYVDRGMKLMIERVFRIWLHPDIIYKYTQRFKEFTECMEWINTATHDIIESRRRELLKADTSETDQSEGCRKIFLDLLLNMQGLSKQDICDEAKTMIVGAYDTTSCALQFIILMLATNPDIQENVYQELYEIYGSESFEKISIELDDLQRMQYLERVIKETLRLFPPTPIILRRVQEDLQLGDFTLPKGSTALLAISKLHRDEKYWKDPLKFDTDRFLPEEIAKRHPNCYVPFSGGPRNCIGSAFAMLEIKTFFAKFLLAYVIKKEQIKPVCNIKINVDILAQPKEPVTIRIEKRVTKKSTT